MIKERKTGGVFTFVTVSLMIILLFLMCVQAFVNSNLRRNSIKSNQTLKETK